MDYRRVQKGPGYRSFKGQDGAAKAEGSRREGEDRAFVHHGERNQPALHHSGSVRTKAPGDEAYPRPVRAVVRTDLQTSDPTARTGFEGCGPRFLEDRRNSPRRRIDSHP